MKKELTKSYILENRGCYTKKEINKALIGIKEPMTVVSLFREAPIPLSDRLWFLMNHCELDPETKLALLFELADVMHGIYNNQYRSDINNSFQAIADFKSGEINSDQLASVILDIYRRGALHEVLLAELMAALYHTAFAHINTSHIDYSAKCVLRSFMTINCDPIVERDVHIRVVKILES
jgi:hypothetical protein